MSHQHRHADILPCPIDFVFPQTQNPLAALDVLGIFPHRLDARFEQMQLAVRLELSWPQQVTVERPPLLDRGTASDKVQRLAILACLVAALSRVPEMIAVLQLMIARRNFNYWQLRLVKVHIIVLVVRIAIGVLHSKNSRGFIEITSILLNSTFFPHQQRIA